MPLFDSHAHYDDDKFNDNREEIIKGLCQKSDTNPLGISAVLNSASDIKSSYAALELTKRYPFFYCSCGNRSNPDAQAYKKEKLKRQS